MKLTRYGGLFYKKTVGVDKIFRIIKLKFEVIGMAEEAERRDVLEKLELIEKALPKIKKLAKEGKITPIPHEEMVVIDALISGVFSVSIKESTVIFHLCKYDLPKID